jgi:hypothetical protein
MSEMAIVVNNRAMTRPGDMTQATMLEGGGVALTRGGVTGEIVA